MNRCYYCCSTNDTYILKSNPEFCWHQKKIPQMCFLPADQGMHSYKKSNWRVWSVVDNEYGWPKMLASPITECRTDHRSIIRRYLHIHFVVCAEMSTLSVCLVKPGLQHSIKSRRIACCGKRSEPEIYTTSSANIVEFNLSKTSTDNFWKSPLGNGNTVYDLHDTANCKRTNVFKILYSLASVCSFCSLLRLYTAGFI